MPAFLSFIYKRQSSAPAAFHLNQTTTTTNIDSNTRKDENDHGLEVIASGSSENLWGPPNLSQDSSDGITVPPPSFSSSDDNHDHHSSLLPRSPFARSRSDIGVVHTPEGLLPRRSADSLRRSLNVDHHVASGSPTGNRSRHHQTQRLFGATKFLSEMNEQYSTNTVLSGTIKHGDMNHTNKHSGESKSNRNKDDKEIHTTVSFPPPCDSPEIQRRSTFDESSFSSVTSPVISTSSFYSRRSRERPVAMSPELQLGKARTAVGALVALQEANILNKSMMAATNDASSKSERGISNKTDSSFCPSLLRTAAANNAAGILNSSQRVYKSKEQNAPPLDQSFRMSVLPPRGSNMRFDAHDDDHHIDNDDENYYLPAVPWQQVNAPTRELYQTEYEDKNYDDGQDDSLKHASPSSIQNYNHVPEYSKPEPKPSQPTSSSFYSVLDEEEAFDQTLLSRKVYNQQKERRPQQKILQEHEFYHGGMAREKGKGRNNNGRDANNDAVNTVFPKNNISKEKKSQLGFSTDDALLRRKAQYQRQEKETLVLEVVARLRDNIDLLNEVEDAATASVATMGNWFVKTPFDKEGLLTGISLEKRNALLLSLDSILEEIRVAKPEEFIVSPSHVPCVVASHDTLCQALQFCRLLILNAIPKHEKKKMIERLPTEQQNYFVWISVPELRTVLGLIQPQSPETVRGGGTSLFSLPDESGVETPHTSNVSIGTTITSVNTFSPKNQSQQKLLLKHNGLQLRHTMKVVASLMQKLTLACLQLGELPKEDGASSLERYVSACKNMKCLYLKLVAVAKEDYKAFMDVFHLEAVNQAREMVLADADANFQDQARTRLKQQQVLALASALGSSCPVQHQLEVQYRSGYGDRRSQKSMKAVISAPTVPCEEQALLFSPSTQDMRSHTTCDYDDLRRQMGSYDREDSSDREERDGVCDYDARENSEEWKRMYDNVSLAASSIRSRKVGSKSR